MKIAGITKCSFVDYPGKIAAVVFTPGCNLRCVFCHNKGLIDGDAASGVSGNDVLAWLKRRRGLLDAVVVSGGEPTLQTDLADFVAEVHAMGYLVKLDTNGTRPDALGPIIGSSTIEYVAMDIKAPIEKYGEICGVPVDTGTINGSIALLMKGRVDYEFRTTVIPQLTPADILAIGETIHGANAYFLQRCRRSMSTDRWRDACLDRVPFWIEHVRRDLCRVVKHCILRGFGRNATAENGHAETWSHLPPL